MLEKEIYEKFLSGEFEYKGAKRIFELLGIKSNFEKDSIRKILSTLEDEGKIVYQDGKYLLIEHSNLVKGTLKGNERGFAFLIPENKDISDFFIPSSNLHGALHKDTVLIKPVKGKRGSSDEGEVVKILSRGVDSLVGTYEQAEGFGFVTCDDKNYFTDIYVPYKKSRGAKTGDKVVVKITKYPDGRKNPEGQITEILGRKFDFATEELSIIKNHGYEKNFPSKVEDFADTLPQVVTEKDLDGRKDFTNLLTITIDGEDSRDFDDAISISKDGENYILFVHIADVSHYAPSGSIIDKEAFSRATSVYFPNLVLPMLPAKLSNGICSLNEGQNRLCLSCIMTIDNKGKVINSEIVESVIKSDRRMTYSSVEKMLDGDTATINEYKEIYPLILDSYNLMQILYKKRRKKGNIDIDVKESHIFINDKGKIVVEPRTSKKAYKIIEEFMICANETVAEYVFYLSMPFIYRVHKKPDAEKLKKFKEFLFALGINVRWNSESCHPKEFQSLLDSLKDDSIYSVVNRVMLRSMQKAEYSPVNVGHFGLSSSCYCHFTSPIRRYPDLIVHRVLKAILHSDFDKLDRLKLFVEEASVVSSQMERKADEVEREMDDFYKCRYMKSRIGEEFEGVISGVTSFGIFVELDSTIEGLVKLETLPSGSYTFDEKAYKLYSNKYTFTLGDRVLISVAGVDYSSKRVEFDLIGW